MSDDLIFLPGGSGYVDVEESPVVLPWHTEAIARAHEATHRELKAEFDTATVLFSDLQSDLDALKTMAQLTAGSPADAQTAVLLRDTGSQTHAQLMAEMEATVPTAVPRATGEVPSVVREVELLADPTKSHTGDGVKFMSVMDTRGRPGTWPDRWIGYVSGHNSSSIWLVSAPDLLGPWKWEAPAIGTSASAAAYKPAQVGDHVASPSVVWTDSWATVFFHGPLASNYLEQPTFAAWTADGRTFNEFAIGSAPVIPTEYGNQASPYKTSTSYTNAVRVAGEIHAVWQGTTGRDANAGAGAYTPMPVGHAVGDYGWNLVKREPIIPAPPAGQGLLAPGLEHLQDGWIVVGSLRTSDDGSATMAQSVGCYFGPDLEDLRYAGDIVLPGVRTQYINSPQFVTAHGRSWMVGGVQRPGDRTPVISAFELDWSAQ